MKNVPFPGIPFSEFKFRIDKAQKLMAKNHLDAIVVFDIDNIRYYSGHIKASYGFTYGWRRGLVIPKKGEVIFVASSNIYKNAQISTWIEDIRPWGGPQPERKGWAKEHETLFIDTLKELKTKRVGVELAHYMKPEISWAEFEKIKKGLRGVEFVDASPLIMEQREIKSKYEQGIIRELCKKVCRVVEKSFHAFKPGMTERDLHGMFWKGFIEEDIHDDPMEGRFMMSGPGRYDAFIMGPYPTPLKKGDTLFIDGGPRYKGYFCDIQRNLCIGTPSAKMKRLHKISLEAQLAAEAALKPGAKASDVFFAALKELQKYDPDARMAFFAGHSMGLYTHELPYLDESTDTIIQPGMYLAVEVAAPDPSPEPCCAVMMPEDNFLITEHGADNLTEQLSKELWVIK